MSTHSTGPTAAGQGPTGAGQDAAGQDRTVGQSAIRKATWRLIPFVALLFFINYLDRTAI